MRILLDTHVLLWCLGGDRHLDRKTAALLRSPASDAALARYGEPVVLLG